MRSAPADSGPAPGRTRRLIATSTALLAVAVVGRAQAAPPSTTAVTTIDPSTTTVATPAPSSTATVTTTAASSSTSSTDAATSTSSTSSTSTLSTSTTTSTPVVSADASLTTSLACTPGDPTLTVTVATSTGLESARLITFGGGGGMMYPDEAVSDDAVPGLRAGASTTFTVGISIRTYRAIVFVPDQQPWGGWLTLGDNPGVTLASDSWAPCGIPSSDDLRVSGAATTCGLDDEIGVDGVGAVEVTVRNPAGGYDASDVSVDLFAGLPDLDFGANWAGAARWDSLSAGSFVSGSIGALDAGSYVAWLHWRDPSGTTFGGDYVEIAVPLCGDPVPATYVGDTAGTLPRTR